LVLYEFSGFAQLLLITVMSPEFTKESSFNLRDTGSHVPDRLSVVGILFWIGLLTVRSRLCTFCSLLIRTLGVSQVVCSPHYFLY
jgi:hypothetical protein